MESELTLGEYMRRLRRDARLSLIQLAERTNISYTHLSRIENDSTVPGAETVAKIAAALHGDLKAMLAMANCLPQIILDRMAENETDRRSTAMLRAANAGEDGEQSQRQTRLTAVIRSEVGLPVDQARELAGLVEALSELPPDRRTAIIGFVQAMRSEAGGRTN